MSEVSTAGAQRARSHPGAPGPAVPIPPAMTDLARESLLDMDRRAVSGIPVCLLCWVGIAGLSGLYGDSPSLAWSATLVLCVLAVARLVLRRHFHDLVERAPRRARLSLVGLILLNGTTVSLLASSARLHEEPAAMQHALVLVGGIVCATSTLVMAIDPLMRFGMPAAVLGPYAVSLLAFGDTTDRLGVVLVVVFAGYLMRVSRELHDDYWTAHRLGRELRERATQYQHLSETDPLTQVANRLNVDQRLDQEWSGPRRPEDRLSLLLVDLDHFKAVNDGFGHPVGDLCLRAAADALAASVYRENDLVARWGGEEFLVVLPGTGPDAARAVAERMRAAVAALRPTGELDVRLTCSIGVVSVSGAWMSEHGPSTAVAIADQALYAAKEAGRDRVEVAST